MTIDQKLHRAWQRERRFVHTHGAATFLSGLTVLAAGDFLIDWLFLLPGYARFMLLLANIAVLGCLFNRRWLAAIRAYSPVRVALQVEGYHPELNSLLVSYVQLNGDAEELDNQSPRLIQVVRRQAIERTSPIEFSGIVDFNRLKKPAALSLVLFLGFACAGLQWPGYLRVLALRMLNPATTATYPTRTQIGAITKDRTIRKGDELAIEFKTFGVIPNRGSLYVRTEGRKIWEEFQLSAEEGDRFAFRFSEVMRTFDYRARLGDARSSTFRIKVIPPPRIIQPRLTLESPPYMDLPKQTLDTLNANVYEGTSLAWDISFSQPLSDAEMMTDDGNRLPIDLSPGRRSGKAFTLPTKSFNYQLRMTLRDYPFSYLDRVHYYVQVLPDGPPKIRIIYPQKEKDIATRSRSLNVRFRAEDDHGISAAWLVYSINKGEEKKSLMNEYSDRTITGKASSKLLALAPYLKEGDSFEYLIEVADNRGTDAGPSLSRSRGHTLEIVSVENFLRKVTGKKKELDTEIEAVNKEEKEGLGKVRSMKDDDEEIEESSTPTP